MTPLPSCAEESAAAVVPLAGTAPLADAWLVIEQHGPYGAKALVESGLPAAVGQALTAASWSAVKVILARPTGRHGHDRQPTQARVWWADARRGVMASWRVADPADLLAAGPTPAACAQAVRPPWSAALEPHLFVCTNGRRDACCARLGRLALAGVDDDAVWECSHLGGHRFAATGVLLPWGYVYGRLTPDRVAAVLADARRGMVHPEGLRGRSSLHPAAQAAEIAVRQERRLWHVDDVMPTVREELPGRTVVACRLADGTEVTVTVVEEALGQALPESCGREPVAATALRIEP